MSAIIRELKNRKPANLEVFLYFNDQKMLNSLKSTYNGFLNHHEMENEFELNSDNRIDLKFAFEADNGLDYMFGVFVGNTKDVALRVEPWAAPLNLSDFVKSPGSLYLPKKDKVSVMKEICELVKSVNDSGIEIHKIGDMKYSQKLFDQTISFVEQEYQKNQKHWQLF